MSKIKKHQFEPVSLLTVENGVLELAVIPAKNQPDWLVPKNLIVAIDDYHERIWTYLWQGREISVYHLATKEDVVDKLVILEGNTEVHRVALQTAGEISYRSVRISDVKDVTLPQAIVDTMKAHIPSLMDDDNNPLDYVYQAVTIGSELFIVPELDLIAHRLVDLDS